MALTLQIELAQGDILAETVLNPDRVRWDMAATRNGWPSFDKAPFLGLTYLAWAALKRQGRYTGTWDDFKDRDCIDVQSAEDEVEDDGTGK